MTKKTLMILMCCAALTGIGCDDDPMSTMARDDASNTQDGSIMEQDSSMAATDAGTPSTDTGIVQPGPRGANGEPALGVQIDRAGRPAISTALIETFNGDADAKNAAKDSYNAATPSSWGGFAQTMVGSLAILDSLDGTCGNQLAADQNDARYTFLAAVLADDQLYVNSTVGECGVYLGAEAEVLGVVPAGAGKCGGRTPNDDIIDRSYSVLAAGILTGVDDTVTEDDAEHSLTVFPWLAAPKE